ncbi:MAG: efflux RND transporter periplasmic adaptor subunit [Methylococcales bacterium]
MSEHLPKIIKKNRLQLIIALIIICVAGSLSAYWLTNRPKAPKIIAKQVLPQVTVIPVKVIEHPTTIYAMGNVIPSQSVNLTSRISGMVTSLGDNFIEGGLLKKGEKIVQLDPTDFKLVIEQKKSDLAQAEFNLKLEQGQQAIAKREFELLGAKLTSQELELVLRKPHLKAAASKVQAAKAILQQAKLDLKRTLTRSPFDAIILQRNANIGSWISTFSTGTPLAKLAGTRSFWVDASVPMDKLKWLSIPGISQQAPSTAKITYDSAWGKGIFRKGTVKRLKAEVEASGRMAKIIVEVMDPLSQKTENKNAPPMVLGTFVRVAITGKTLHKVIALPESTLHDGRYIWLIDQQQFLKIKEVSPVWAEQGVIYLKKQQLPNNAQVISSNLSTPVEGMKIRVVNKRF